MKKFTKFVILTMQRTGSTMLVSALNSHPQIRCYGELLLASRNSSDQLRKKIPDQIFNQLENKFLDWNYRVKYPL